MRREFPHYFLTMLSFNAAFSLILLTSTTMTMTSASFFSEVIDQLTSRNSSNEIAFDVNPGCESTLCENNVTVANLTSGWEQRWIWAVMKYPGVQVAIEYSLN